MAGEFAKHMGRSRKKGKRRPSATTSLTAAKARKILHDKSVRGHPLTDRQRRFFGAVASKGRMKG